MIDVHFDAPHSGPPGPDQPRRRRTQRLTAPHTTGMPICIVRPGPDDVVRCASSGAPFGALKAGLTIRSGFAGHGGAIRRSRLCRRVRRSARPTERKTNGSSGAIREAIEAVGRSGGAPNAESGRLCVELADWCRDTDQSFGSARPGTSAQQTGSAWPSQPSSCRTRGASFGLEGHPGVRSRSPANAFFPSALHSATSGWEPGAMLTTTFPDPPRTARALAKVCELR